MRRQTGFGYDPGHSIVKARQDGLDPNAVLYKPFRLDQLLDTVEMVKLLSTGNPNLKTIIPHHHNTGLKVTAKMPPERARGIERRFNSGTNPTDVSAALQAAGLPVTFLDPELGKVYELKK